MIEAQGIGRRGPGGIWLWRGLDLSLVPGRVVGLLGRNGTGKTTLIRTMLGLIEPHEGVVKAESKAGYVPQRSQIAFPFTVRQVVNMGRVGRIRLFSGLSAADRLAVDVAMDRVGVSPLAERSFHELSGGERQLALIARAIAAECGVILLDEPFSGLDLDNQVQTLKLLYGLAQESGLGVLFSTHQPDHLLAGSCTALALMHGGSPVSGPSGELLTDRLLSQIYQTDVRIVEVQRPNVTTLHAAPHFGAYGTPPPEDRETA